MSLKARAGNKMIFAAWLAVAAVFPALAADLPPPAGRGLSDLAIEEMEKKILGPSARNPFTPADIGGEIQFSDLSLEGLLWNDNIRLVLISGRILQAGDTMGRFTVMEIAPGKVKIQENGSGVHLLRMASYNPPLRRTGLNHYSLEFRNADIRDTLQMLGLAAGYNLIMPEGIRGQVNLSFNDISLKDAMRAILKVNQYSFAIENGIMRVGKPDDFQGGTDLMAVNLPLKYAKATDLEAQIKLHLSDKGSVTSDERSNSLSLKDYDANVENIRQLIASVDQRDRQVMIEAHIVDASSDFSRALGIKWGASGKPHGSEFSGGDSTSTVVVGSNTGTPTHVNLPANAPTAGMGFRIGSLPGASFIDLQLSAAESKGDVQILSKPSVVTMNNMPAQIRSGLTIYVKANSDISIGTSGSSAGASESNVQAIETGIELNVTPQIAPDDYIKLTIEANESEADFSQTVDGIPAILDNTAKTTVLLKNGDTAVIGGLIKKKDSLSKKSVPGLSKIPVVGLFFKSKQRNRTHNELMVFIKPRILE